MSVILCFFWEFCVFKLIVLICWFWYWIVCICKVSLFWGLGSGMRFFCKVICLIEFNFCYCKLLVFSINLICGCLRLFCSSILLIILFFVLGRDLFKFGIFNFIDICYCLFNWFLVVREFGLCIKEIFLVCNVIFFCFWILEVLSLFNILSG